MRLKDGTQIISGIVRENYPDIGLDLDSPWLSDTSLASVLREWVGKHVLIEIREVED
jgi:hypothetical protein